MILNSSLNVSAGFCVWLKPSRRTSRAAPCWRRRPEPRRRPDCLWRSSWPSFRPSKWRRQRAPLGAWAAGEQGQGVRGQEVRGLLPSTGPHRLLDLWEGLSRTETEVQWVKVTFHWALPVTNTLIILVHMDLNKIMTLEDSSDSGHHQFTFCHQGLKSLLHMNHQPINWAKRPGLGAQATVLHWQPRFKLQSEIQPLGVTVSFPQSPHLTRMASYCASILSKWWYFLSTQSKPCKVPRF